MSRKPNSTRILLTLTWLSSVACAGTIPYEVVMVSTSRDLLNHNFIRANIDLEEVTFQPIPPASDPAFDAWSVLAVQSSESILIVEDSDFGGEVAQFNPQTNDWAFTGFRSSPHLPHDMEVGRDGHLYIGGEFSVYRMHPVRGPTRPVVSLPDGIIWWHQISPSVEIDSSGAIIFNTAFQDDRQCCPHGLFRQRPGEVHAELLPIDIRLQDFVLESDDSIIGLGDGVIYRVSLDTGASNILFEDDELSLYGKIQLDPDDRVVGLSRSPAEELVKLVRIDLNTGTIDLLPLDHAAGFPSDMDILIVPEPPRLVLLLSLGLLAVVSRRRVLNVE